MVYVYNLISSVLNNLITRISLTELQYLCIICVFVSCIALKQYVLIQTFICPYIMVCFAKQMGFIPDVNQ